MGPFTHHVGTKLIESVDKINDRSLAHPFDPIEPIFALPQCYQRCEKTNRRSTIADKNISFPGRNLSATAMDAQRLTTASDFNIDAQLLKPGDHHLGVFALECPRQERLALGERRANERAIGNAL